MAMKKQRWRRPEQLNPGIRRAIEAAGGTMTSLADLLEIAPQAVAQWDVIPADRLLDIERVTKVPRNQLRSDLFRGYRRLPRANHRG